MGTETNEPPDLPYGLRIMPMAEEDLDGIFDYIAKIVMRVIYGRRNYPALL
ncbi:hypothetical protein FACS189485_10340 [Spirochaetia bacterium]|nr:hypothetical protein FACS189485_10340 [Spirochaetia bacterium]